MRLAVLAGSLSLTCVSAVCAGETPLQLFLGSAGTIERNGAVAARWVTMLPVIAGNCHMRVDARALNAYIVGFTRQNKSFWYNGFSQVGRRIDGYKESNPYVGQWAAIMGESPSRACDVVDRLWGEMGQQYPGILVNDQAATN